MIRPGIVWAIARAELRLTRRLVRFWIFAVIGGLLAIGYYAQFAAIYGIFSWASASAASANPRFFAGTIAGIFLLVFGIGMVFLGYDVRSRDTRERMSEVLDALPCSNLELLLGRFVGVLLPSWTALFVITLIIQIAGLALGMSMEPWSILTLLFFMAVPAFALTLSIVYLFSVLVPYRLVVAPVLIGFLILPLPLSALMPIYMLPLIDFNGGWILPWPSDIVPVVINLPGAMHRGAMLLGALGLLWIAAAVHPRRDDSPRGRNVAIGLALVLVAATVPVGLVLRSRATLDRRAAWLAVHTSHRDDPAPDIESVAGRIRIVPGERIEVEVALRLEAPADEPLDDVVLTLNPGLTVQSVRETGGADLTFAHADGLLRLSPSRPIVPGAPLEVDLVYSGRPDPRFAYLDQALDLMTLGGFDGQLVILGRDPMLLDRRYVALLPGIAWFPVGGSAVDPGTGSRADFFDVDLTVEIPQGWLAAGPGRRQDAGAGAEGGTAFRFAPPAPVPAVALVAAPFVSRSIEIDGVLLEVLHHPRHGENFEMFEEGAPFIRTWLEERLAEAREVGLGYPYDGLTMAETPNQLRGYGGGWRMDTTLAQPAMILTRESGFPTAYYRKRFEDQARWQRFDGGIPEGMRWVLETFFENDINGGNPFIAASRGFFLDQTAGQGPDALPLDWVWDSLATRLITDKSAYFSVWFFDRDFGQVFQRAGMATRGDEAYSNNYAEALIHLVTSKAEVWDAIMKVSLADLDPWEDPETAINVLSLKGSAMAQSMLDALGREKVGRFLATLRERTAGRAYTRDDVLAAGNDVGIDLGHWLSTWIEQTDLPGFNVGDVHHDRIPDDTDGTPRYQTRVVVRNDEAVSGLLLLEYTAGTADNRERGASDPVEVPGEAAVEIGLVTSKPLQRLRVKPYLALNRDPFPIPLPALDEERIVAAEPFVGTRESAWVESADAAIVVDDLDDGFSVEDRSGRSLRVQGKQLEVEMDQGLPVVAGRGLPRDWSRSNRSTAWGKYRRTAAVIRKGAGDKIAVFTVDVPRSGPWRVEYHLSTPLRSEEGQQGTWNLTLVDGSGEQPMSLDTNGADAGWNTLGTFEVAAGEVRVEVSDLTDGRGVVADAIRFTPPATSPPSAASGAGP